MDTVLSIGVGVGLAAACGLRVFVPLLAVSVASLTGHVDLAPGVYWMGTLPALVVFGTATVFEVAAFFVPLVDNLLDTVAAPAAVLAGTLVVASQFGELDPFLRWTLALIAGGGTAGVVNGSTALVRGASTVTTAGLGNPIVAVMELAGAVAMSLLAVLAPFLAFVAVVLVLGWALARLRHGKAGVGSE